MTAADLLVKTISTVCARHGVEDQALQSELVRVITDTVQLAEQPGPEEPGTTHVKTVSGMRLTWNTTDGTFQFSGYPATLMWVDSTLAGLWTGMRDMVGERRFGLALQHQGRESVDGDWTVIAGGDTFEEGFALLCEVAASAGWGRWQVEHLDREAQTLIIRASHSWEQALAASLGEGWDVGFLAGKFAGYGTRLFGTNCWADYEADPDSGGTSHVFRVYPSERSLESELQSLLSTDNATRADLAVAVQRLTNEVAERKRTAEALSAAKRQADEATRSKSQFLANMSHELRTPMHGVLGSLELLADAELPAHERRLAEDAVRAARSLLRIVGDVLDISKIEAGKYEICEEPFDLHEAIRGTLDVMVAAARSKNLELRCRIDQDVPRTLRGDEGAVRQILLNLLGNAIKFTPRGEIEVFVQVGEAGRAAGDIRVFVRDTGVGIAKEDVDTVFESFQQGGQAAARVHGGTGLGLAISRHLAREMGGDLVLHETSSAGSTFCLQLELPVAADCDQPGVAAGPADAGPDRIPARVLVVDDSAINRKIARLMVEKLGCTTEEATDGEEALEALASNSFDIVLMDVMMPVLDGLAATRRIREGESGERQTIIAMTANAVLGDRERCLDAGMDDYLTKPVSKDELRRTLNRWYRPVTS